MLKLYAKPEYFGFDEHTPFDIVENDRGEWKQIANILGGTITVFEGFGGENVLSVHLMGMMDGSYSATVVHSVVDNPNECFDKTAKIGFEGSEDEADKLSLLVNGLIAEAYARSGIVQELEFGD